VICQVCSAPALRLDGACVFCRSPLADGPAADADVVAYLAERLPAARVRRGLLGCGPVRRFEVEAGGEAFSARLWSDRAALRPELELMLWADRLLAALSRDAAADRDLRTTMTRSGWRLR
jgi:hypothetical protein